MKHKIIRLTVLIIVSVLSAGALLAQQVSGVNHLPKGGLIGDVRAKKIGDIVTILINESTQASNRNATQTNKQNSVTGTADFGGSFLRNLTGSISADTQNQFQGSGQVTSQGSFVARITATIIEVKEDGNFLIRGSKEMDTNGEKVVTVVEGIIRPNDISRDNTISSSQIADARIFHQGSGVAYEAKKPSIFSRILNWIF